MQLVELSQGIATFSFDQIDLELLAEVCNAAWDYFGEPEFEKDRMVIEAMESAFRAAAVAVEAQYHVLIDEWPEIGFFDEDDELFDEEEYLELLQDDDGDESLEEDAEV